MRLSVGLTSNSPIELITGVTSLVDSRPEGSLWVGEDIGSRHDIFTLLAALIPRARNTQFGIGITSPLYHNITTIARASALLTEVGTPAFRLGLGIGGLEELAKRRITFEKPVNALSDAYRILNAMWMSNSVSQLTAHYHLDHYSLRAAPREKVPVYFGVRGPKLLYLAGRMSGGVILSGPKPYLAKAVEIVNQGAKAADRRREEMTVVVWNPTYITQSGKDIEQVKRITSFVLADMPDSVVELADLNKDEVDPIREDVAAGNIERAAAKISDDLLQSIGIFGDEQAVCNEMRTFGKLGVDEIIFGPPYGRDWRAAIATVLKTWESS